MSNTNDFVPFGIGEGANTLTPAAWAAYSARALGFVTGTAPSAPFNTAWRQSSTIAAMIGQFTADYGPGNVQDNGNIATLEEQFVAAILSVIDGSGVSSSIVGAEEVSNNILTPPSNGVGNNGQYYIGQTSGNIWGPKSAGAWPSRPEHMGNNALIFMSADTELIVVNALVYWNGSAAYTLTLIDPGTYTGNNELTLFNNSTVNQTVNASSGLITSGNGQWPSPVASITLAAGQAIFMKNIGDLWIVLANTGT